MAVPQQAHSWGSREGFGTPERGPQDSSPLAAEGRREHLEAGGCCLPEGQRHPALSPPPLIHTSSESPQTTPTPACLEGRAAEHSPETPHAPAPGTRFLFSVPRSPNGLAQDWKLTQGAWPRASEQLGSVLGTAWPEGDAPPQCNRTPCGRGCHVDFQSSRHREGTQCRTLLPGEQARNGSLKTGLGKK